MMQIGVIGSSRTLTGSRLVTKTILAAKCRFAKFVISQAGNSETCRPPNLKTRNIKTCLYLCNHGSFICSKMNYCVVALKYLHRCCHSCHLCHLGHVTYVIDFIYVWVFKFTNPLGGLGAPHCFVRGSIIPGCSRQVFVDCWYTCVKSDVNGCKSIWTYVNQRNSVSWLSKLRSRNLACNLEHVWFAFMPLSMCSYADD